MQDRRRTGIDPETANAVVSALVTVAAVVGFVAVLTALACAL